MIKDKKVYYAGANGLEIFAIEGLRDLYVYNPEEYPSKPYEVFHVNFDIRSDDLFNDALVRFFSKWTLTSKSDKPE